MMQREFWETEIPEHSAIAWEQGFKSGANVFLKEIRGEVERRKKRNILSEGKYKEDIEILSFIDSISKEK